jgi:hypothetical protein
MGAGRMARCKGSSPCHAEPAKSTEEVGGLLLLFGPRKQSLQGLAC